MSELYRIGVKTIGGILSQFDKVDTVKGSVSSGAVAKYLNKSDSLVISKLTDGGFAQDIYFYKDYENECVMFEYTYLSMLSMGSNEDFDREVYETYDITKKLWYVNEGVRGNPWADIKEPENKMIVFSNGKWWLIDKIENGGVIPLALAIKIDEEAASQIKSKEIGEYKDNFVNVKEFANKVKENEGYTYQQSLLSKWEQDGLLHIMINTDIKNNYYLYNRTDDNITINCYVNMQGTDEKVKMDIINGFKKWSGVYKDDKDFVELGGKTVTVKVNVVEHEEGIEINVDKSNEKSIMNSTVTTSNAWKASNVGVVNFYQNYNELNDSSTYMFVAAHELGHVIGLGDAYEGAYTNRHKENEYNPDEVLSESIMMGLEGWDNGNKIVITANEIEMVQYANVLYGKQYFYGDGKSIGITVGGKQNG